MPRTRSSTKTKIKSPDPGRTADNTDKADKDKEAAIHLQQRITALESTLNLLVDWIKKRLPDSFEELLAIVRTVDPKLSDQLNKQTSEAEVEVDEGSHEVDFNSPCPSPDAADFLEDVEIKEEEQEPEDNYYEDGFLAPSPPFSPSDDDQPAPTEPTPAPAPTDKVCTHCSKIFDSTTTLARHLRVFHSSNPKIHICATCGRTFDNEDALEEHVATHWPVNTDAAGSVHVQSYQCKYCIRSFRKPEALERHSQQHLTKPPSEKFPCRICGNLYGDKGTVKVHIREVHKGVRKHACSICPKTYKKASHLKVHLEAHKKAEEKRKNPPTPTPKPKDKKWHWKQRGVFPCSECGKVCTWKGAWTKHIQRFHSSKSDQPQEHQCPTCGKTFRNLQSHMKVHSDELPEKCRYCPYACRQKGALRLHESRHLATAHDHRLCQCPICGNLLTDEKSLRCHIQQVHEGVRKYPCPICPSRFKKSTTLKTHLAAHAKGARPRPLAKEGRIRKVRPGGFRRVMQVDPLDLGKGQEEDQSQTLAAGEVDMEEDQISVEEKQENSRN